MIFKTAITAAALGATVLPGAAILNLAGAEAANLQVRRVVCARCGWKPGRTVQVERPRVYVERFYFPRDFDADAYDREYAREYWKGIVVAPQRVR